MPRLLPVFELSDPDTGACVPLIDNCASLAYMQNEYGLLDECVECCPECEDVDDITDPTVGEAWWTIGTSDPAANRFFGLLADSVELEPSGSIRRRGETSADRPPWTPRQLTIEGRLIGEDFAALYFGQSAITGVVAGECGPCDGWEASTRVHCPEFPVGEIVPPETFTPDGPPPLVDGDECVPCGTIDPAWTPQVLQPGIDPGPTNIDSGRRNLLRVRFVYLDDIDPPEGRAAASVNCPAVQWVRLVFEVLDDYEWGDPIVGVCDLDRGWDTPDSGYCRWHDWTSCLVIPPEQSCDDPAITGTGALVETPRNARVRAGKYCQPLLRSVRACLTPALPTSADIALGIDVWSGSEDTRNLRFDVYPAFNNAPSPETCEGELIYRRMVPCAQLRVPFIPANSWLTVDGRRQQTWLECNGRAPVLAGNLLEGWGHPVFDPTCRFWIVAVVDCYHTAPDFRVPPVAYHPRWFS